MTAALARQVTTASTTTVSPESVPRATTAERLQWSPLRVVPASTSQIRACQGTLTVSRAPSAPSVTPTVSQTTPSGPAPRENTVPKKLRSHRQRHAKMAITSPMMGRHRLIPA